MIFNSLIVKIKRAETPFYARLKRLGKAILAFHVPVPRVLDPVFTMIYSYKVAKYDLIERISVATFRFPVLRARCVSIGKGLQMDVLPYITGPMKVYLGDEVRLSGPIVIDGGRVFPNPELRVGNRTFIGGGCRFSIAKSVTVGDDVLIAGACTISDYSGHPLDPEKRIAGEQVDASEVRPIRIENKAWLGRGAAVLPGVTIGEGAVIGAGAVVTKDVPPGHICVGNPGRLLSRTVYEAKPAQATRAEITTESAERK